MISVVYVSSGNAFFSSRDLFDVLRDSRAKNTRLGVTGLLLHVGGNFMQLLEGEEATVDDLYDTIASDPRHRSIKRLLTLPTRTRLFMDWAMAFREAAELLPEQRDGVSSFLDDVLFQPGFSDQGSVAMRLLQGFATTMR